MQYNPALDGIRALAVLTVIARHCEVPGFTGGVLGVDVFFVLSGFLITTLLRGEYARTGRIDFRLFYVRRFLRLGPPLMLLLAAYLIAAPFVWPDYSLSAHIRDVFLSGFYLSDITRAFWGTPLYLSHTWSLSVEEHFYLLWPLVAVGLFAKVGHRQALLLLALFAIATVWRIVTMPMIDSWMEVYYRFDARISGLVLGALVAVLIADGMKVDRRIADIAAGASLIVLAGCVARFDLNMLGLYVWGFTIVEVASVGLIIGAMTPGTIFRRCMSWKPLVSIGLISYGLYLWHGPIARALTEQGDWVTAVSLTMLLSLPLAAASYWWLEIPMRDLRYRIKGREPAGAPALPRSVQA